MQSEIEKKVMGNVAMIYVGRPLVSATALKLYVLALTLIAVTSAVSVPHVVANLLQVNVASVGTFMFTALMRTKLLVQIGLLVGCVALASLIIEFFKRDSARRLAI